MTIMIYYHCSGYKTFKDYYCKHVLVQLTGEFKQLVSYNRFVELMKYALLTLALFLRMKCLGKCTGISFIDSSSLKVCHNKRIHSNKVFKGIAKRGKTSIDWFFGFKLHLVFNHFGEIVDFLLTQGNIADNNYDVLNSLTKQITGKLFGDKGYILKSDTFQEFYDKGVHFVTKIRTNMKNILMNIFDKLLLKKRGLAESAIGNFKSSISIEHTRHRSPINFLSSIFSALIAYSFRQKKPSLAANFLFFGLPA